MNDVTITTTDDTVTLLAHFDPALPGKAKALGGKFVAATKAWRFAARDEQRVRDLAREIYGTDGADEGASQTVTVRITVDEWQHLTEKMTGGGIALNMLGRRIASRRGRDDSVRLGDGVILVAGGFPASGGSVANPRLEERDGTVLEIRDVPATHRHLQLNGITVVDTAIDRDALAAERERLVSRLIEIDALLGADQ